MRDTYFEGTLVLVWRHDETGALGVVINKVMPHDMLESLELPDDLDTEPYRQQKLWWGGPVEEQSGTVLTLAEIDAERGWLLDEGIGISRSMDVLQELMAKHERLELCLGYAGWGPGQLEAELKDGSWLWTEVSAEFVFSLPVEERYGAALATLGLTPQTLWMPPAEA